MPVIKRKIQRERAIRDAKLYNIPKIKRQETTMPSYTTSEMLSHTTFRNSKLYNTMAPCTPPEAFMPPKTELSPFDEWLEVASDRLKERITNGEVLVVGVFNSIWVGFNIHGMPTNFWA